jgi:hypothetical protein
VAGTGARIVVKTQKKVKWRPLDLNGIPWALPHDFDLATAAALATLEVDKDEWIGVYRRGDYPPYGEVLCASHFPKALCRKLKQLQAVFWPLSARLARTKEELIAPLEHRSEERLPAWQEELRLAGSMTDDFGFITFSHAWDTVRQLSQTNDAIEKDKLIEILWRWHPDAAEKLRLPKQPASSLSQSTGAEAGVAKALEVEHFAERQESAPGTLAQQRGQELAGARLPRTWAELQNRSSISQKEAAQLLKCDPRTVRRRLKDNNLTRSPKGRVICNERLRNEVRKVHGNQVLQ